MAERSPIELARLLVQQPQGMWGNVGASMPEAYGADSPIKDPIVKALISAGSAALAPGRVYNSETPVTTEQMIAPAAEMAGMLTLGAGAVPAGANELRAGVRPYQNVPDGLMGYRKNGQQRGFYETNYPHEQPVQVIWPDRDIFNDVIKGMNPDHALERAYRNWPGAMHITPK